MHHQAMFAKDLNERIPPGHTPSLLEQRTDDDVEFHTTQARVVLPVVLGLFDDERLYRIFCEVVLLVFVKGLPAITKQPAESTQR